ITASLEEENGSIYFTATAGATVGKEILGFGILFADSSVSDITVDKTNVFVGAAQGVIKGSLGQFVMKVNDNAFQLVPRNNFKARAYIAYRDAGGNVAYAYSQVITYNK
ncbi:MAG: hypothetical protein RSD04_04900, partial [Clostridia bacterium]